MKLLLILSLITTLTLGLPTAGNEGNELNPYWVLVQMSNGDEIKSFTAVQRQTLDLNVSQSLEFMGYAAMKTNISDARANELANDKRVRQYTLHVLSNFIFPFISFPSIRYFRLPDFR
jgi:hypothetical protein